METEKNSRQVRRQAVGWLVVALALLTMAVGSSSASAGPLYDVKATWADTNLPPGGDGIFKVQVRNLGDTAGSEDLIVTDQLPDGVTVTSFEWKELGIDLAGFCSGVGTSTATCTLPGFFLPFFLPPPGDRKFGVPAGPTGYAPGLSVRVDIDPAASGTGTNTATVSGGGAPTVDDVDPVPFSPTPASFGMVESSYEADVFDGPFPFGAPTRIAGAHPFEQRVNFDLNAEYFKKEGFSGITSHGIIKTVELTLPRGMLGNPEATPKCDPSAFAAQGSTLNSTGCPADTQVGIVNVRTAAQVDGTLSRVAIYNLEPPKGVAADFAFNAGGFVQAHIYAEPDPSQDYAIKTITPNISSFETVLGSEVTFWGVPGDPAHDKFRAYPHETADEKVIGAPWGSAPIRPLLTNPADCGVDNGGSRIRMDSYNNPGIFTPITEWPNPLNVTGCDDPRFRFEPEVNLSPTDSHAGAPTGLNVHLEVPQRDDVAADARELYAEEGDAKGIATPPMKRAVVRLPEGMTLSPSAAQGLGSCSPEQIGLGTNSPVRCPDDSQYGTLTLHTPILPVNNPPKGFIYIAKQGDNPFHNFLTLYLTVEEPERGILIKIPGKVDLDPVTGRLTTTFDDLPQFPVSDLEMTFKGGVRAGLVNPSTCGEKTITAEFFSWHDPSTPHTVTDQYEVSQNPDGSPCVNDLGRRPFAPKLEAGTVNPIAGADSPFVFRLTRTDDDQEFSQLNATLPTGLGANFAGVGICSDAAIAQAERRTAAGDGAFEQNSPSCPANSEIGTTQVGVGVGVPLTYVPGKVYLAGPYKGAPMSMVVISPAIVGPFDLGVISVRTALDLDPTTAQATAKSDPFPQIFQGIPVRIRDIRLKIDRPGFTYNPTSCARKAVQARVTSTGATVASAADDGSVDLSDPFQVAECASLKFKPKLSLRLLGGTNRGDHPKLRAVLRARRGDANIGRASVGLPHSEFLEQGHIRTVCTRVQFAAENCPRAAIYGFASAKTPIFDEPLGGPVYLRSSDNPLPDLVAVLEGPDARPIEVDLVGRIDSVRGGIRNTFAVVPDAPVTKFTLTMLGGKRGLLVNSTNLCAGTHRATAKFTAQNGRVATLHPNMRNDCKKKGRARHGRGHRVGR
jgi:uncharacterized repeat protein (TIGR01451 family)